jgi:protein-S-isoprenylcysteine O-methyltransferase Ste14
MFLGVYLYTIAFVGGLFVPKTIDAPLGSTSTIAALAINIGLLLVFALQHSIMARPTFKKWWTRFVPAPAERSTYVLASNQCVIALFALWQPLPTVIWDVQNKFTSSTLWFLFAGGWMLVLVATFLINHFDLFGLRQVWLYLRGREYTHLPFATPLIYKYIRHPLYVGWMTAFWATPTMTVGHLLFAVVNTGYMLIAIFFEERNLVQHHGRAYEEYRKRTGKLLPRLRPRATESGALASIKNA